MNSKLMLIAIGLLLLVVGESHAQYRRGYNNSIGVKVGSPLGVSYKTYFYGRRAIEFVLGTTPEGWYDSYYRNKFDRYDEFDGTVYDGHVIDYSVAAQGRMLFHYDFPQRIEGFEWYWGVGGQLRVSGAEYRYTLPEDQRTRFTNKSDFALGGDAIAGIEYVIPDVPLTAFADVNLFMELLDNPFSFRVQGGIGIRYDF
jgi:hypothetical protein